MTPQSTGTCHASFVSVYYALKMFDLGVYLNIRFSAGLLIFPGCSRQISKTANIDGGYVVVVLCWVSGVKSGEIQAGVRPKSGIQAEKSRPDTPPNAPQAFAHPWLRPGDLPT